MESSTNVIYITSGCNLNCEYCYEKENRPNYVMSDEEIDSYFEYLNENSLSYSHIVLFGGEPLLCLDKIEYIVDKIVNKYSDKKYSVSMNTNGLLLLDDNILNKYLELNSKIQIYLKISYDGSHSYRRKDYNGICVNDKILEVLNKLENKNIRYSISYTWQKENYKTIIYDLIDIIEKYHPQKIEISVNCQEIGSISGDYEKEKELIVPHLIAIYKEYNIPLCEFVCNICKKCVFNNTNIYGIPGKLGALKAPKKTNKEFTFW